MNVYPIFLNNLAGRRCVVVGGNHEAEQKALGLAACEADVVVVAPAVTEGLRARAAAGALTWEARPYRAGDLKDTFLVIVAERDPVATEPIFQEAQAERVLINALDDVPHCTFVQGSVVRRGPLVVAVSTSGVAPALAVRLRQRIEMMLGPAYERLLHRFAALRAPMAAAHPDFDERRRRWYALVDADLLPLVEAGDEAAARRRVAEIAGDEVADAYAAAAARG